MTDKDFSIGTFEGMTLARLDHLQKGMDALASKVDTMCGRCIAHAERLIKLETKAAAIITATRTTRWVIGVGLTLLGLALTAIWLLYK